MVRFRAAIGCPRLSEQRDVKVGVCSRPQANLADFYREMGDLFGVELRPHNRWAGAKVLCGALGACRGQGAGAGRAR